MFFINKLYTTPENYAIAKKIICNYFFRKRKKEKKSIQQWKNNSFHRYFFIFQIFCAKKFF
jgi:hypothetical protein